MHRSRLAFTLGAVVSLVLVSGCSGDPEPRVAPSPSVSTSTATSPSPSGPVEPVMPEAARAHTAAGAEAFVEYYWEMVNYAQASGDLDGLTALADGDCGACSGGVKFLKRIYGAGGYVRGGQVTVTRVMGAKARAGSNIVYRVVVTVATTPQVVDLPGTKNDEKYPGGPSTAQFIVDPIDAGWSVAYWDRAPA